MAKISSSGSGTSLFTLLGVLFIGLKLANVIDWSWWVVLSPIWGSFALILLIVSVYHLLEWRLEHKNRS